jgi:hypothetical protein
LFPNLHLCVDRDVLWQDGAGGGFIIVSWQTSCQLVECGMLVLQPLTFLPWIPVLCQIAVTCNWVCYMSYACCSDIINFQFINHFP